MLILSISLSWPPNGSRSFSENLFQAFWRLGALNGSRMPIPGCAVSGLRGFGVLGLGFEVLRLGFEVPGLGFEVLVLARGLGSKTSKPNRLHYKNMQKQQEKSKVGP